MRKLIPVLLSLLPLSLAAAEQVPPLTPVPGEACHIADPIPLLQKEFYLRQNYQLVTVKKQPLTIRESVTLPDGLELVIEQVGCEDKMVDLHFRSRATREASELVFPSLEALSQLKLSPNAFLPPQEIAAFTSKLKMQQKPASAFLPSVTCLLKVNAECITDIAIQKRREGIAFHYVDRP